MADYDQTSEPTTEAPSPSHSSHVPDTSGTQPPMPQLMRRPSRRAVIVGLAGLTLVGGGITWFTISHRSTSKLTSHSLSLGATLYSYRGHSNGVTSVAWSPDGKYIACGSTDNTVQVCD